MAEIPEYGVQLSQPDGRITKAWYQALALLFRQSNGLANETSDVGAGTMPGNFTGADAADARHTNGAVKDWLALVADDVSGFAPVATVGTYASLTGTWALVESMCGIIEVPQNGTYRIGLNMPFGAALNSFTTRCDSGTCTAVVTIDGASVGGLSNAVSTTEVNNTATSANTFTTGQDVGVVVSGNSSCRRMSFQIKMTRTLP